MAVNALQKIYTPEHILNASFDRANQTLGVEQVLYNQLSGNLVRGTSFGSGAFALNDLAEVGSITYIGMEDAEGTYVIEQLNNASGLVVRYATILNNPTVTTYADAWAARATTLVYNVYSTAF